MLRGPLAVALVVTSAVLGVQVAPARAQSCCSLVSEDEISVVPPQHRAVVSARLAAKQMLFLHDLDGESHPLANDVSATDVTVALGAGLRFPFHDRLQLHGSLPVRLQLRSLPAEARDSSGAVGPGDAGLFLRWSALYDDERGLFASDADAAPSLDLHAGVELPTGRYVEGGDAHALARTMGAGSAAWVVGLSVLKYVGSTHGARISTRYAHRFARSSDPAATGYETFTPGAQLGFTAGYWLLDGMRWLFGAALDSTWTLPAHAREAGESDRSLAHTAARQTSLGVQVIRVLHMPDLELMFGVASDLPLPALSANVSWEGVQASVALRYHVLDRP